MAFNALAIASQMFPIVNTSSSCGRWYNSPDPTVPWRAFNPLRRQVLMMKARTIATLAAAGTLLFFGGKYALKKYRQYHEKEGYK